MTSGKPRIIERKRVYKGWNSFDLLTVEAADHWGTVGRHVREVVDHGAAAVVLTIDRERGVALLVRQWRAGLIAVDAADPYLIEACAGILEPGETPEEAARREAEEELGLKVRELRSLGTMLPSVGTLTERMHLFVADVSAADLGDDRRGGMAHEGEHIEVVEVPLQELYAMARRGALEDGKTLVIVQRMMIEELEGPGR
ncbi:MAG: NUDIX domain-containing protein [Propylenella sp.]